jgi:hypothetical protein
LARAFTALVGLSQKNCILHAEGHPDG